MTRSHEERESNVKLSVKDYTPSLPGVDYDNIQKKSNVSQGIENCSYIIHAETERRIERVDDPYGRYDTVYEHVSQIISFSYHFCAYKKEVPKSGTEASVPFLIGNSEWSYCLKLRLVPLFLILVPDHSILLFTQSLKAADFLTMLAMHHMK